MPWMVFNEWKEKAVVEKTDKIQEPAIVLYSTLYPYKAKSHEESMLFEI